MEIDITRLLDKDLYMYSASVAELGDRAGELTWSNSLEFTPPIISTPEEIEEARDFLESTGGWDREEIASFSDREISALILQFISGDLREYLRAKEEGEEAFHYYQKHYGGSIFEYEGKLFFYLGN